MVAEKERRQLYILLACAMIVLAVSIWAFRMEIKINTDSKNVVEDRSPNRNAAGNGAVQKDHKELDIDSLAEAVLKNVSFDTKLQEMDASVTESMISTASDDTEIKLYMGEGTCADELLIVKVNDEGQMDQEIQNVQAHLTDMQQSFQDYLPKEAKKIDDAVILQSGKYIIACVSGDKDTAGSVIRKQLKGGK